MNLESGTPTQSSERKIRALIQLLGDDDPRIRKIAGQQLMMIGDEALPFLEATALSDGDGKTRIHAQELLSRLRREELMRLFHLLGVWDDDQIDLEYGAYLIAKAEYPDLTQDAISKQLDELAAQVAVLLDGLTRPRRIVQMINNVLFTRARFEGNYKNYYAPDNAYLNRVLTTRKGIPLSLSLVYLLVARRLDLPIYGVSMPAHFLCKFEHPSEHFYIDPFDFGRVLNESECIMLLHNYGVAFNPRYLEIASNREILCRMLRNLILVYYQSEQDDKAEFLKRLLKILKHYAKKENKVR